MDHIRRRRSGTVETEEPKSTVPPPPETSLEKPHEYPTTTFLNRSTVSLPADFDARDLSRSLDPFLGTVEGKIALTRS